MRAIVTGAAGFIGSNLVERLLKDGYTVDAVDNMHTGSEDNLRNANVKLHKATAGEIGNLGLEKPEVIFHQGVYSSTPMYMKNHMLTHKIIEDFMHILEYSRKNDIKNIVYASTSSIYNGLKPPHSEDMTPLIKDFYTEGRYAMERIGELYHKLYGLQISGMRYFSVYGPHERSKKNYANLISQFLWSMSKDEKPVVYGDGSQTRDFTYVEDIVNGNVLAYTSNANGIFNLGTGKCITINEMIGILNKKLGKNLEIEYVGNPIKNYVQYTLASTEKSKKEIGFEAKVSLEEGIEKLIEYYKSN